MINSRKDEKNWEKLRNMWNFRVRIVQLHLVTSISSKYRKLGTIVGCASVILVYISLSNISHIGFWKYQLLKGRVIIVIQNYSSTNNKIRRWCGLKQVWEMLCLKSQTHLCWLMIHIKYLLTFQVLEWGCLFYEVSFLPSLFSKYFGVKYFGVSIPPYKTR